MLYKIIKLYFYTQPSKSHSGIKLLSELKIAQLFSKNFCTVLLLGNDSMFCNFSVNKNEFQTKNKNYFTFIKEMLDYF